MNQSASLDHNIFLPAKFIDIEEAPIPQNAQVHFLVTAEDMRLRVAAFDATSRNGETPRGTVILLHGRCEFMEKYFEVIKDLQNRHFNVVTFDFRGQGLSSRMLDNSESGHIKTFGTYRADLRLIINKFAQVIYPCTDENPYIAMSHSMGGAVLLSFLAEGTAPFKGAILSSPMTRLFNSSWMRGYARFLANFCTSMGFGGRQIPNIREDSMNFEGNSLTSDRNRHNMFQKLLEAAPAAAVHAPTYGWMKASLDVLDSINKDHGLSEIRMPICIVQSGDDTIIDPSNAQILENRYPMIETKIIPLAKHEVLMENDILRDKFWVEFDAYTQKILG